MAFHFALATLLRLRESIERQRALRLQEANLAVAEAEDRIMRLEQYLADSARFDAADLAGGRRGAELQFASLIRGNLETLRQDFRDQLRQLQAKRQQAAVEYQRAFREREALETLRARQRRAYQQQTQRREQRDLDAAFLIQSWRKDVE